MARLKGYIGISPTDPRVIIPPTPQALGVDTARSASRNLPEGYRPDAGDYIDQFGLYAENTTGGDIAAQMAIYTTVAASTTNPVDYVLDEVVTIPAGTTPVSSVTLSGLNIPLGAGPYTICVGVSAFGVNIGEIGANFTNGLLAETDQYVSSTQTMPATWVSSATRSNIYWLWARVVTDADEPGPGPGGDPVKVVTGGVMDSTQITPQKDGASPVVSIGGLCSSIIGVSHNAVQGANDKRVFSDDDVADHVAQTIGNLLPDGTTPNPEQNVNTLEVTVQSATQTPALDTGLHVRYETASAGAVAVNEAFPNGYVNNSYYARTVEQDGAMFSTEPPPA